MIFAVFDVLLAVNMCVNYSFFTFILLETLFCRNSGKTCPRHAGPVEKWGKNLHRRTLRSVDSVASCVQMDKVSIQQIIDGHLPRIN